MLENYDLVVVGSGWYGLGAARAYIQAHPEENIAILERDESVGGTWSQNRLYPGLKANNMLGSFEFPDFPMSSKIYDVEPGAHIPGAVLERYLTDFAREFGILERIRFGTFVTKVVPTSSNGWELTAKTSAGERSIQTSRLILATGLTSTPNMPDYRGAGEFGSPLFHVKDFGLRAPELVGVKNVVVVGGAKSAYDVAHHMADSGATVDIIIRPNGKGPVWMAPRYVTPLKKRLDTLLNVRLMSWFSPCPWASEGGYSFIRRFLHNTAIGRLIVKGFWKALGDEVLTVNQYDSHSELQKLKPWNSAFWIGSGLSILNYDTDVFEMVRQGKIRVHVEDVDSLAPNQVVLSSGQSLRADALICATGWRKESSVKFDDSTQRTLALDLTEDEQAQLNAEFDKKIVEMFPILKEQPQLQTQPSSDAPLRYYRFIVPPTYLDKRNLAFAGMISNVSTSMVATAQGIWISRFFDGTLARIPKSNEGVTQEVMLHTQWGKWRYPCGYARNVPDFVFDGIPYMDLLLNDVGLQIHRKSSAYAELTSPYTPRDYDGLLDELEVKKNL